MRQHPVKQKTTRKKADPTARSHTAAYGREEEGSEDEGAISLNAIKNKYKGGASVAQKGKNLFSLINYLLPYTFFFSWSRYIFF